MVDAFSEKLIQRLGLEPHPEGGHYREVWRSALSVTPGDGRGPRAALTLTWFLLPGGAMSRWHRIGSEEVWSYHEGGALELLQAPPDASELQHVLLGPPAPDRTPIHCVPAGWWQAARSTGSHTLVSCTVAPGFEFSDFEMLADRPDLAEAFCRSLPQGAEYV